MLVFGCPGRMRREEPIFPKALPAEIQRGDRGLHQGSSLSLPALGGHHEPQGEHLCPAELMDFPPRLSILLLL